MSNGYESIGDCPLPAEKQVLDMDKAQQKSSTSSTSGKQEVSNATYHVLEEKLVTGIATMFDNGGKLRSRYR